MQLVPYKPNVVFKLTCHICYGAGWVDGGYLCPACRGKSYRWLAGPLDQMKGQMQQGKQDTSPAMSRYEAYGVYMIRYLQRKSGAIPDSVDVALKTWRAMGPGQIDRTYKSYNNLVTFFAKLRRENTIKMKGQWK